MAVSRRPSYAWARLLDEEKHPEYAGFVEAAEARSHGEFNWSRVRAGIRAAQELAEHARRRRRNKVVFATGRRRRSRQRASELSMRDLVARAEELERREQLTAQRAWERLGMPDEEIALTPVQLFGGRLPRVMDNVKYARRALFGDVRDRAVRYRLERFAELAERELRYCTLPGCENALPPNARSTRKRCDSCRATGRRR
jgi:hypothetical protein